MVPIRFTIGHQHTGSATNLKEGRQTPGAGDLELATKQKRPSLAALETSDKFCRILLVRMRGLEPPHPCEYMDLNHARLPIPPHPHIPLTTTSFQTAGP